MNNKCYQGGKRHKFVARYSEEQKKQENKSRFTVNTYQYTISAESNRRLDVIDVYICDICVWCGKTRNK